MLYFCIGTLRFDLRLILGVKCNDLFWFTRYIFYHFCHSLSFLNVHLYETATIIITTTAIVVATTTATTTTAWNLVKKSFT